MPQVGETRQNPNNPNETASWDGTQWVVEGRPAPRGRAASTPPPGGSTSGAPDMIGRRQEYQTGVDEIARDRRSLTNTTPFFEGLDRFENLNIRRGTGGFMEQIPAARVGYANMVGGPLSEMQSISADIQTHNVPQNQGPVSDFERHLYSLPAPDINRQGPVNQNLINTMRATRAEENDRVAFFERWLQTHGSLNGANEAWQNYTAQFPYRRTNPQSGQVEVVRDRPRIEDTLRIQEAYGRARQAWLQTWQARRGNLAGAEAAFNSWWNQRNPQAPGGRYRQPARQGGRSSGGYRILSVE